MSEEKNQVEVKQLREVPAGENHCGRRMTKLRNPGTRVVEGKTRSIMVTTRVCDKCGEQFRSEEML